MYGYSKGRARQGTVYGQAIYQAREGTAAEDRGHRGQRAGYPALG